MCLDKFGLEVNTDPSTLFRQGEDDAFANPTSPSRDDSNLAR